MYIKYKRKYEKKKNNYKFKQMIKFILLVNFQTIHIITIESLRRYQVEYLHKKGNNKELCPSKSLNIKVNA